MKKIFLILILSITTLLSQTASSFFDLYEQNRKEQIPNYISLDFILTANYLFKQQRITQMEEGELYGDFKRLAFGLKSNLIKSYVDEKKEALAYVLVLNHLLGNKNSDVPNDALALANEELELILKHSAIGTSPIAKVSIDYTQFSVRGKYVQNEALKSYFLALKYMSYIPFMVNANKATGVTEKIAKEQMRNALYLSNALTPLMTLYTKIEKQIYELSGEGDDLSLDLIHHMSSKKIQKYLNGLNRFPKISERIIDTSKIKKEDITRASLALKLLPSRFTPDSYIFSMLTYPNVGQVEGEVDRLTSAIDGKLVRGYPTIMDISAVLTGEMPQESNYEGYAKQIEKLKQTTTVKLDNLYAYDFAIYQKLLEQNKTNSFKGYYTQSRYLLNLYQKQSYTGGLKSMFFDKRKEAFMEENISSILELLIQEDRLLSKAEPFIALLEKLIILDKKANKFTPEEIRYLNNLDNKFKYLLDNKDSKISVDIHTNPVEGKILYEILDEPFVRMMGKGRGAFYNHREEIRSRR